MILSNTMKNSTALKKEKTMPYENNPDYNSEDVNNFISVKQKNYDESDQIVAQTEMKQNKSISSLHIKKSKVQSVLGYEQTRHQSQPLQVNSRTAKGIKNLQSKEAMPPIYQTKLKN